jgi:SAM-dependent methyltransferase
MSTHTIPATHPSQRPLDEAKLHDLLGMMVSDLGACVNGALVLTGDKLGLYRALAEGGPQTSAELAERTGISERYAREWLSSQAASDYIEYSAAEGRFWMSAEQKLALVDEDGPCLMTGGFYSVSSVFADEPKLTEAFRTGKGLGWEEHNGCLFCGTAKFFRPSYQANLLSSWIPSLNGREDKLTQGAKVADVGCGHGISTVLMAQRFPNSTFVGFDMHEPSIEAARKHAEEAGLKNVTFEVATAKDFPEQDYDLICFFDCLHDMGDPVGACAHVNRALAADGSLMVVEPMAGDTLEENLNPVGRVYYAFSATVCTPASLNQEVGLALGAQAGEKRLAEVVREGGFGQVRRAAETPFNLILEARK